jgi:hypothetical protein
MLATGCDTTKRLGRRTYGESSNSQTGGSPSSAMRLSAPSCALPSLGIDWMIDIGESSKI